MEGLPDFTVFCFTHEPPSISGIFHMIKCSEEKDVFFGYQAATPQKRSKEMVISTAVFNGDS